MVRAVSAAFMILAVAVDPILPQVGDVDLVKYAVTQGGLLAVVLVLMWSYRRDWQRTLSEERDRSSATLTLAKETTFALTRSTEICERLTKAVEKLEDRRR